MNETDSTQDRGLSTEQIAAAGTAPAQENVPAAGDRQGYENDAYEEEEAAPTGRQGYQDNAYEEEAAPTGRQGYQDNAYEAGNAAPLAAHQAATGQADWGVTDTRDDASVAAGPEARASLLEDGELQSITMRWKDIQAEFVDEPTQAIQQADALVAELMQRLATMFAAQRADLENRWAGDNEVSTEDLRQGLRRYRSFFERLLAA